MLSALYLTQLLVSGIDVEESDALGEVLRHVHARVESEAEDGVHDVAGVFLGEGHQVGQLLEGAHGDGRVRGLEAADVGVDDGAAVPGRVPQVLQEQVVRLWMPEENKSLSILTNLA